MPRHALRLLVTAVLIAASAFAQRDLGTLLGTVSDPQGAVIAGAKVIITEEQTGQRYELTTDSDGNYIRPLIKPGTYSVEVEAAGFRRAVQKGILLSGGDRSAVNIALTVGEITQTIEVTAAAPLLQTESTVMGDTMQAKTVVPTCTHTLATTSGYRNCMRL